MSDPFETRCTPASGAQVVIALLCSLFAANALAFGFDNVAQRARQIASLPYERPSELASPLQALTYEQYRDIRFKPQRFHWRGSPFELAFFHRGFQFQLPVKINEIDGDGLREIRFNPEDFDYGANKLPLKAVQDAGFAGFRVHFPVNSQKYKDEVLVFLGASYFRALGKGQVYGISARGLAVDTAMSSGEEFPHFKEFWIERPAPDAKHLTIYALLDSRRVTGAYQFILRPGSETAIDVRMRLYPRENIAKVGIAPLTSMYLFGENQHAGSIDYRPEVHNSDGLSIRGDNGEWIWRPLINPRRLVVTSFTATNPAGFGLMQRDRAFAHYEDIYAQYQSRPSVWITPKGKWGAGRIELIQIPTPDETNQNIVAFWIPATPPQPKQPYDIEYRMLWQKDTDTRPTHSWVTQSRLGSGYVRPPERAIAFMIDFEGPALSMLPQNTKVEANFTADANAKVIESTTHRNDITGGWRVAVHLQRIDEKKPVELRGVLHVNNVNVSETWSYVLPPE
ncbi:MAG TPA: glucan biosynthesis protein G [Burkholderiales bacterium]|nr:glucan biosynthesis protein G [Burkholderiales bacterium]